MSSIKKIHTIIKISTQILKVKIFTKSTVKIEDPTRYLLDAEVEYFRWYPYFELENLKFLDKDL